MIAGSRTLRSTLAPAVLLLAMSGASCSKQGPIDGSAAMRHVEALVKIGARPFGSPELAKATDYLCEQITKAGQKPVRHEVLHAKEQKTIRNVYAQIDGEDPQNGPILMFGAHYDTKLAAGHDDATHNFPFVGAIDGGGAPAILLELLRTIGAAEKKPKCNVGFFWIDAEESIDWVWNDNRALLGSQEFCKKLSADGTMKRVKAFVLLDLMGSKNLKFDKDGDSTGQLIDLFAKVGQEMGIGELMFQLPPQEAIDYYRQNNLPWGIKDDHLNFKNYGVPSVLLIDFQFRIPPHLQNVSPGQQTVVNPDYEQWWHTPDDNLDAMDAKSLALAGNLVMQALPKLEEFVMARK